MRQTWKTIHAWLEFVIVWRQFGYPFAKKLELYILILISIFNFWFKFYFFQLPIKVRTRFTVAAAFHNRHGSRWTTIDSTTGARLRFMRMQHERLPAEYSVNIAK